MLTENAADGISQLIFLLLRYVVTVVVCMGSMFHLCKCDVVVCFDAFSAVQGIFLSRCYVLVERMEFCFCLIACLKCVCCGSLFRYTSVSIKCAASCTAYA